MPFKPGQSGNPGGRSKALNDRLEKFRNDRDLLQLRQVLFAIAMNEGAEPRDRITAIKEWHDRAYGKPAQAITGKDGGAIEVNTGGLYERISAAVAGAAIEADEEPTGEPN